MHVKRATLPPGGLGVCGKHFTAQIGGLKTPNNRPIKEDHARFTPITQTERKNTAK